MTFQDNFITLKEFSELLNVKRTTFFQMMKDGKLPEPISIFTKQKVWKKSVVQAFIQGL